MKKIFSFILVCLIIIPATILVGCGNDDYNAKNVRNKTYYLTSLIKDSANITSTLSEKNARIFFSEDHFKFEISNTTDTENYGYYLGTYTIDEGKFTLKATEFGGYLADAKTATAKQHLVLEKLNYYKDVLTIEFVCNNSIYQYQFKIPKK